MLKKYLILTTVLFLSHIIYSQDELFGEQYFIDRGVECPQTGYNNNNDPIIKEPVIRPSRRQYRGNRGKFYREYRPRTRTSRIYGGRSMIGRGIPTRGSDIRVSRRINVNR